MAENHSIANYHRSNGNMQRVWKLTIKFQNIHIGLNTKREVNLNLFDAVVVRNSQTLH